MTTPPPATFGVWTELRPAPGRQPDSAYYRQRLDEAVLAEQLGFTAVWGSEHHAVEDAHLSQQFPYLGPQQLPQDRDIIIIELKETMKSR